MQNICKLAKLFVISHLKSITLVFVMRKIEFRGYSLEKKKWIIGQNILADGDNVYINGVKVEKESLGQNTGFKDDYGNDVFDGDIIEHEDGPLEWTSRMVVEWKEDEASYALNFADGGRDDYFVDYTKDGKFKDAKIVGNMYETPELFDEVVEKYNFEKWKWEEYHNDES